MRKKYIIVDDDEAFITLLTKQLRQFEELECIATYTSTIDAARGITKLKPDILFLDMQIDGLNGLDVLEVLDKKPKTIVISSSKEFLEDAFTLEVYDYLIKPITDITRLQTAIRKVT